MKTLNEFINEMVAIFDELDSSDLQGIVEAECAINEWNENDVLDKIYDLAD